MDLKLPNLGEGADSGTVVNVFVKVGDQVANDQPVIELENEKAVASIPSTAAGTVTQIYVKAGDRVQVGQRIMTITGSGESEPAPAARREAPVAAAAAPQSAAPGTTPVQKAQVAAETAGPLPPVAASPAIRQLARDLGIDLSHVRGSERGGRIVMDDLRAYVQGLQEAASRPVEAPRAAVTQPGVPAAEPVDFSKWGPVTRKSLTPLRQVIARRMSENWHAVPRVTQFDEADITALEALRKKHAAEFEQQGTRLTLTAFALKVVAAALKKHPGFNSSLDEAAQELVVKEYYHIGVAVDTEAGLIVPVIRDVDRKSVLELSRALEELAKKARDRTIGADQLKGGSFTISNQGGIGSGHFTPIVNRPEVAILGLGRGAMKPVVRGDKIEARLMMPLAVSYDHRVIDGGAAARFTVDLVKGFENFEADGMSASSK